MVYSTGNITEGNETKYSVGENDNDSSEVFQAGKSNRIRDIDYPGNDRKRFDLCRYATRILEEGLYLFLYGDVGYCGYWWVCLRFLLTDIDRKDRIDSKVFTVLNFCQLRN